MKSIILPLAASLSLLTASEPAARDPRVGDIDAIQPSEKVERALNGTFQFPPSPAVPWSPDETGFAKDRLFSVPPPGVHPRILFGPSDIGRIRRELEANAAGRATIKLLRDQVASGIDNPQTWEGKCFGALAAGDLDAFKAEYVEDPEDDNPPGSGFRSNASGRNPATKWSMRNPLLVGIEAKALLALLDDDAKQGKRTADALATYARYLSPKVDEANAKPRKEFHWYSTRYLVPNEVAYGYDWAWKWMTPDQREELRDLIVRATAGKFTLGMDLPAHWRNWNHIGMTESYAACLFAIEGEPGDDPRGRDRIFEVYRDYLTYAIDPLGTGTEGIGYQTAGIGHISGPLVAFANRGKNLLTHPHWKRHTESWLVQAMQPFGEAWQSCSDLANFPPNLSMLAPQKYFFPDSPGIDFTLRNHPLVAKEDWTAIAKDANELEWILPLSLSKKDTREAAQEEARRIAGNPLTYWDKDRGFLYARAGWGPDDLVLHVDCKSDTTFANHDHPDRGQFTLAALGRTWACDGYRDTEGKYHNVVTIDGRGQGYFTPPGAWVEMTETPGQVVAVTDAKYPWDWFWTKSTFTESKASLEKRDHGSFWEAAERLQQRVPVDKWEPDPLPVVSAYNEGFATRANGDPRMWDDEDGWVLRAPWYPVQKAFRTTILSRGKHPYVLVADDIRKDDQERLYEWRMNMPPDIETVSIKGGDILLGDQTTNRAPAEIRNGFQGTPPLAPKAGDRLLLLRTLDLAVPEIPTLQPIPSVSKIEYKKTDDSHQFTGRSMGMGTQVVIGSRSVEPKFLMLLYPHRQGDELPQTSWNDDRTRLTISWKDQTDTYAVKVTPEGRRAIKLVE
jgi:hypothetical protein